MEKVKYQKDPTKGTVPGAGESTLTSHNNGKQMHTWIQYVSTKNQGDVLDSIFFRYPKKYKPKYGHDYDFTFIDNLSGILSFSQAGIQHLLPQYQTALNL